MSSVYKFIRSVLPKSADADVTDYVIPPNPYAKTDPWRPTEREIKLIRQTWSEDASAQEELGLDIYTIIFYQVENAKDLFPQLANVPVSELRTNADFRNQAFRFCSTIDFVVKHLENMDIIREYLMHIGGIHIRFMKRGFRPTLWPVFKEAIELAIEYRCEIRQDNFHKLSDDDKSLMKSCWIEMAVTIVKHMYNGFADAAVKALLPQEPKKEEQLLIDSAGINKMMNPFAKAAPWLPTEEEIQLVHRTWSSDTKQQEQLGLDIYSIIFDKAPGVHKLFPQVTAGAKNIQANPAFRSQALKFVTTIDYVVKNLEKPKNIDAYLCDLGATHVRYAARGFEPSMWKHFKDAIELAVEYRIILGKEAFGDLNTAQKEIVQGAWTKLAILIVQNMYVGYEQALTKPITQDKTVKLETPGPNPYANVSWAATTADTDLLKRVWSKDPEKQQKLGLDIYQIIFSQMPDIKKFFPYLKADDAISQNENFLKQASRIVGALDYAVNHIDNPDSFNRHLQQLGARHVRFASRGFTPGIWVIFKEATELAIEFQSQTGQDVYGTLSQSEKTKVEMLWSKLAAIVVQQMYEGFASEVHRINSGGKVEPAPAHPPASQPQVIITPHTPTNPTMEFPMPENQPVASKGVPVVVAGQPVTAAAQAGQAAPAAAPAAAPVAAPAAAPAAAPVAAAAPQAAPAPVAQAPPTVATAPVAAPKAAPSAAPQASPAVAPQPPK